MNYAQAETWFLGLCRPLNSTQLYAQFFYPIPTLNPLKIEYPGYKNNGLDYRLSLNNFNIPHTEIVRVIYNLSTSNYHHEITEFLIDINQNGLLANHNRTLPIVQIAGISLNVEQFKALIFWVTLQENFNYPAPKLGIRMPFYRYIEAVIAARHPDLITLQAVLYRTGYKGKPPFKKFTHPALNPFYIDALKQIMN